MRRLSAILILSALSVLSLYAQDDAKKAAAEAAAAMAAAPEKVVKAPKPTFWTKSLMTNLNFIQSMYSEWAKGGFNNYSMSAYVDANANYAKNNVSLRNRLQLDYGFLYSQDKPILQKNKDRILYECTFGYKATNKLNYSAKFTLLTQFSDGYDYPVPAKKEGQDKISKKQWRDARHLKSGLFAPATVNLGLGMDWVPNAWLSVNFAPLTGGFTIVSDKSLRKNYSMERRKPYKDTETYPDAQDEKGKWTTGKYYRGAKFEFGAQLTADVKVRINSNFDASSHLLLFSNYRDNPQNIRVNWDTRFMWKVAKFFSLNLTTNLIYDDKVFIINADYPAPGHKAIQFYEALQFGFTYTFASKK